MSVLEAKQATIPAIPLAARPVLDGPAGLPMAAWTRDVRPSVIQRMLSFSGREDLVTFALGLPAPEFFPVQGLADAAERNSTGAPQFGHAAR